MALLVACCSLTALPSCARYGCPSETALQKGTKKPKKGVFGYKKPKSGLLPKSK